MLKLCPFCSSEYIVKNDGMGVYHRCNKCGSIVYSFAILKRLGFKHQTFRELLNSAKQNQTEFSGHCISCEKPYREVKYETEGYCTTIYVCPTCFLFAIKKLDLPLFRNSEPELLKPEKTYSSDAEKILNEMDEKLSRHENSLKGMEKPIKMMSSKIIGFFVFLICLIIVFVRISFRYAVSSDLCNFFLIFLFIFVMVAGLFIIFGGKNILENIRRYIDQL